MKKFFNKKIFKITGKILKFILTVFVVSFILLVCIQRFSDNKLSFFNYRIFAVISGSMKPEYDIGSVLIAKSVDASEVKVGDDISYLGKSGSFYGKVITHRVVDIDKDENGKIVFHTKGLANTIEDPYVSEEQLYGVVIYKTKLLSFVYQFIGTSLGFILFIIVPMFYIIGSEFLGTLLDNEEKRRTSIKE